MSIVICPECQTKRFALSVGIQASPLKNKTKYEKFLSMTCHNLECKLFNYHFKTPPYERQFIQIHKTKTSKQST